MNDQTEPKLPSTTQLILSGIVMTIFGLIALGSPVLAGAAVMYIIGTCLLMLGGLQVYHSFQESSWTHKILPLILGVLMILCGASLFSQPLLGMVFLTLVLAIYFIIQGVWKIVISFSYRPAPGWVALLGSGFITLILGYLIWSQWPLSGIWAIGILLGVDLLMTGLGLLTLGMTIRPQEIESSATPVN